MFVFVFVIAFALLAASSELVFAHSVTAQKQYTQALSAAKKKLLLETQKAKRDRDAAVKKAHGKKASSKIKTAKSRYKKRIASAQKAYKKALLKAGDAYTITENDAHADEIFIPPAQSAAPTVPEPSMTPAVPASQSVRVAYTNAGFSPRSIAVKRGTAVIFLNESDDALWIGSDPHPLHEWLPGFDSRAGFQMGESYTFVFVKAGSWGYHNHVNPGEAGMIIVTE